VIVWGGLVGAVSKVKSLVHAARVTDENTLQDDRDAYGGKRMPLIDPGEKAPDFSLQDQHGETRRLRDFAGRPVILYFYPRDNTPGCTREACSFEAALPAYEKEGAAVLGVSVLDSRSKSRFAEKHGLTFPLLADADHQVAEQYGAWQKRKLYGVPYTAVARITYLIDAKGNVVKRWDKVDVKRHAAEVLAAIDESA
jgi:peroxiredoxin Q/BCP